MTYPSIRIEGQIFSGELLQRLDQPDMAGQRPADFGLPPEVKVKDEIARAWSAGQSYYRAFKAKIGSTQPSALTPETRHLLLLPLLSLLGYRPDFARRGEGINGKTYPISHRDDSRDGLPIHLLGWNDSLDKRRDDGSGPRMSAHALVQEYLNVTEHLYGLVSNGRTLRLLRDSTRLVRQSFIEVDLERMFEDDLFADFAILFRLLHASRLPTSQADAPSSLVEKYHQDALDQGARIRDGLRVAVEQVLILLGNGFLEDENVRKLFAGPEPLTPKTYYHHLLRLVYRLLFLLVAEDRGLIHPHDAKSRVRTIYNQHYAVSRLRRLALRAHLVEKRHADLWQGLLHTFRLFEFDGPGAKLGIAPLGGHLFGAEALGPLGTARLANAALLQSMACLCYFTDDHGVRTAVNYGALATEEFGSVYESLLELNPVVEGGTFSFRKAAGNERKTSGSYYTPDSLVQCLLDSALEPVLEEATKGKDPEEAAEALLKLKVCDPAAGSGHFLLGAAHRMARRLALIRSRGDEPSPAAYRTALREVIGRCIYAVDINPMAVELCRINLWLEAMEPGKPLTFLDHHIQCGNALLGATPGLMARGIPDEAFEPIEGDDRKYCSQFRKQNKAERSGQMTLFGADLKPWDRIGNLAAAMVTVDSLPDDTPEAIRTKEQKYAELVRSGSYESGRQLADAWCAAFVWKKCPPAAGGFDYPITHELFTRLERSPTDAPKWMRDEIRRLAAEYRFFHWHLAFPEVFQPLESIDPRDSRGWKGGFDLVLGNPPWDTLSPDAKEFFSAYAPEIRFQAEKDQAMTIANLCANAQIAAAWESHRRGLFGLVHFLKQSGRYVLYAEGNLGKGDFNIYRMFVELALGSIRPEGRCAQLVPEGIYNGANCAAIRNAMLTSARWELLCGFENAREVWFKDVHTAMKFALYVAAVPGETSFLPVRFNIRSHDELAAVGRGETLAVPVSLIREFSPDALAIMEFTEQRDIDIAAKMYARWPKFGDESAGPPMRDYMREVDMGNDRDLFSEDPAGIPLYEGRMIDQYDHRAKGYRSGRGRASVWEDLPFGSASKSIQPQWHIPPEKVPDKVARRRSLYRIAFCDVGSPTNERSLNAALIPRGVISSDTTPTITFKTDHEWAYMIWLAVANSFCMDYLVRKKINLHIKYTTLDSLPFPRLASTHPVAKTLVPLALRLTCSGPEMTDYWNALASEGWCDPMDPAGPPPGEQDPEQRRHLRAQIDAIVARDLFGLTPEEMEYILATFPITKADDERQYGDFRTLRLILASMAASGGAVPVGTSTSVFLSTVDDREPRPHGPMYARVLPVEKTSEGVTIRLDAVPREALMRIEPTGQDRNALLTRLPTYYAQAFLSHEKYEPVWDLLNDRVNQWVRLEPDPQGKFQTEFFGGLNDDEGLGLIPTRIVRLSKAEVKATQRRLALPEPIDKQEAEMLLGDLVPDGEGQMVAVYNVGQGLCSALCDQQGVPLIYFDFGCGCYRNARTRPRQMKFCFTRSPAVVLSHWDSDHYLAAKKLDDRALGCTWIVPEQVSITPSARRFAALVQQRGVLYVLPKAVERIQATLGEVIRCDGDSLNNSGIATALRVYTKHKFPIIAMRGDKVFRSFDTTPAPQYVLLPGDADFRHIPGIAERSFDALVATHHGAPCDQSSIPKSVAPNATLAVSFGAGNSYDHPDRGSVLPAYALQGWGRHLETPDGSIVLLGQKRVLPCGGRGGGCNLELIQE